VDRCWRALGELRHVETAARHGEVGRLALQRRELPLAIAHLSRALELEPENPGLRYQLGMALLAAGRMREAAGCLQQVVAADPGHAFGEALLQLGRVHLLLGDDQGALALLRRHALEHGGSRRSHFWLASACRAAADPDGARAALQYAASPPAKNQRLTPEEGLYRARARVALWRAGAGK